MAGKSFNLLSKAMKNRPWYEKLWSKLIMINWICRIEVYHIMMKQPRNQLAIDKTIEWIKDDIEFGYDAKTIYDKIILGQYDNTPEKS